MLCCVVLCYIILYYIILYYIILYYKRSKPPTCTYFSHSCGNPQGGDIQTIYYKIFKIQCTNVKY